MLGKLSRYEVENGYILIYSLIKIHGWKSQPQSLLKGLGMKDERQYGSESWDLYMRVCR